MKLNILATDRFHLPWSSAGYYQPLLGPYGALYNPFNPFISVILVLN